MRPAHPSMYGHPHPQPAYLVPQSPVQYYAANHPPGNAPSLAPHYGRNPQEMAQPSQQQLQPTVYLVHQQPVMHQYPSAVVGVPVGNPVPQAMAMQGVPAYGQAAPAQGWSYGAVQPSPSITPVWGYGADRSRGCNEVQQEARVTWNSQRALPQGAPQGYFGNGAGGGGSFQGRVEGHGNGVGGGFQGRGEAHGNGVGVGFQGRGESHGNVQPFGKAGGEGRRPERGFESSGSGSRHYPSGAPGRQHMNHQGAPLQSPAPSQIKQLGCEACEKTFAVPSQYTAHMNTHVQCDEIGCSFSASGKVVKEHKLTAHSKSSNLTPMSTLKAARKVPEESNDEIKAWREERKRNYPTRLNIQRKKEVLEGKVARGELIEEDARKRRQRMKEILAKQAELGVPVAEVPAYYLSQPYKDERARGRKNLDSIGKHMPASAGDGSSASMKRKLGEDVDITTSVSEQPSKSARMDNDLAEWPTKTQCENPEVKVVAPADRDEAGTSQPSDKPARTQCLFYQRGRCRKGSKCHYAHTRGKKGGVGGTGQGGRKAAAAAAAALEKKRPPTLLSKLLQADITRDKSYILQCLRFFVNNNFLLDGIVQPSESAKLALESDAAEDISDYSEGEVVEAPDMLLADTAIINTLISERPEVLAKVMEMETQA